ncbi:MAG: hypothetical protein Q9218_001187 [Villophora microphyllina]
MDFIEGIGERYLIGKANAVPQQLENLVKSKAFKGDDGAPKAGSVSQNIEKDSEIEKLRKQLAEVKAGQNSMHAPANENKQRTHSAMKGTAPTKHRQQAASVSGESSKSKQATSSRHHEGRGKHEHQSASHETPRGRSNSVKTAVAASPHSNAHDGHGSAYASHSGKATHSRKEPSERNEKLCSANHEIIFTRPVYQERLVLPPSQHKRLERARSDPDFCVVEVTEEEPQRRRRRPGKANFVEVIDKNRSRTRYVVR